jgi:hypothetical protein
MPWGASGSSSRLAGRPTAKLPRAGPVRDERGWAWRGLSGAVWPVGRGEGGQDGGGQHAGSFGRCQAAGVDLLGRAVHQAVEGRHQPGPGQVDAKGALGLAAGDEPLHPGHGLVVVAADAGRRQVTLRGGQQAGVLVDDPPGRADQPGQRLGAGPWSMATASSAVLALVMAWARTASVRACREGKWP